MSEPRVLIVIDRPPYGDWYGREALDMAFSLAAFDHSVALLFRGSGVNWLRPGQDGTRVEQKTVSNNLGAATIFGVEVLYAERQGLERYGLIDSSEPAGITAVDLSADFYRQFHQVVQP